MSAARNTTVLFQEDWSGFKRGPIHRDNTPNGEYMAMLAPVNHNGWYHTCRAVGGDPNPRPGRSAFKIAAAANGRRIEMRRDNNIAAAVVLTRGEELWRDFSVAASIEINSVKPVGLVARYRANREFYAAVFESGMFKLVRMFEGMARVLDSAPFNAAGKTVAASITVKGDFITAAAAGIRLQAKDGCVTSGGIGIWANGASSFGTVTVKSTKKEITRISNAECRREIRIAKKQSAYPAMRLLAKINVKGHAFGRQIRFADLDGDGRQEIIFGVPEKYMGKKWPNLKLARLSALNIDGETLWERGKVPADPQICPCDMPYQVADRGNGVEVVAGFGWNLMSLDARTGAVKKKVRLWKPPKMEPFWDEIQMYFGSSHGDDIPYFIPDSMRLCNLTGRSSHHDLLLKDRYHNMWGVDGKSFKPLWHHQCNTGHFPFTCDMNGDGIDEILAGYSRLDAKGKLIGRLFLGDHPDACFSYVDCHGTRHNMHPCGEAGFIDEFDDYRIEEMHLGHVQHLSVANFDNTRPDLERIIVTFHHNEGVIVMMDMNDRILRRREGYGAGTICQPVNWTGDGRELIAFSPRHGDGGLWDSELELAVPFPNDRRPGKYLEVVDIFGLGVDQLVVWDEERLYVYGPAELPAEGGKAYRPERPHANLSNYQVNYSIPRWVDVD